MLLTRLGGSSPPSGPPQTHLRPRRSRTNLPIDSPDDVKRARAGRTQAPRAGPGLSERREAGPQIPPPPVTQHPQRGPFGPLTLLMSGSQTPRISPSCAPPQLPKHGRGFSARHTSWPTVNKTPHRQPFPPECRVVFLGNPPASQGPPLLSQTSMAHDHKRSGLK
ncbi:unnamed protein product [Rangifer tarandus platyrhynchus]|uniref:Uncharacterized protein n=1 Tax=Rangifer tarandus platyrhynchus TaxID=3082113 RepID=A0AC59YAG0_RANTA